MATSLGAVTDDTPVKTRKLQKIKSFFLALTEKKLKSDTLCIICADIIHEFPKFPEFHKFLIHEFPSNSHSRPTEKHS